MKLSDCTPIKKSVKPLTQEQAAYLANNFNMGASKKSGATKSKTSAPKPAKKK